MTINGGIFYAGATAYWGKTALVTTLVSANQLTAAVPASLIAAAGTAEVTVKTTPGTSAGAAFTVYGPPVINSISPATAGPGDTIVINGNNFGTQQGTGYLQFVDNQVSWGAPGDVAVFKIVNWTNIQISFLVPTKDPNGYQVTPGTTATVAVTNSGGLTSGQKDLPLHSAVTWPVSINTGATTIGTTGNGFMQTTVSIDQAGSLTANPQVWDNSPLGILTGFSGAVAVRLYDTFGNIINTYSAGPFGVEGGQNNTNPWTETLTAAMCAQLYSIAVVNFFDPQNTGLAGITSWIENNGPALLAVASAVVALV
jgi:hypothetical protein